MSRRLPILAAALALPDTGMAVSFDVTNGVAYPSRHAGSIHPISDSKLLNVIIQRLALAARHVAYGEEKVVPSGPILEKAVLKGGEVILSFSHVAGGLATKYDPDPAEFEILEGDTSKTIIPEGKYVSAEARIGPDKKTITIDAEGLKPPLRVRYASDGRMPRGNLYNTADLPASPFITDPITGE